MKLTTQQKNEFIKWLYKYVHRFKTKNSYPSIKAFLKNRSLKK